MACWVYPEEKGTAQIQRFLQFRASVFPAKGLFFCTIKVPTWISGYFARYSTDHLIVVDVVSIPAMKKSEQTLYNCSMLNPNDATFNYLL